MVGPVLNEAGHRLLYLLVYAFVNLVRTGQTGNTHLRHSPSLRPHE
jgi:hypothetical protein